MDKGWSRDMRSSAKVPPTVLFGQRVASLGTTRGATAMAGQPNKPYSHVKLPPMASASNLYTDGASTAAGTIP